MRKSAYLSKCLVQAFKKISQKQISEKIQNLLKEIYELEIGLKTPDMGKLSMTKNSVLSMILQLSDREKITKWRQFRY